MPAPAIGAEIERLDIGDLETRPAQTDKADIRPIFMMLVLIGLRRWLLDPG